MSLIQQKASSFSPIKNYNDSISRFDPSSDIYSTRATPLQQKRAEELKNGKRVDSMETSSEKSDRVNPIKVNPQVNGQALKIARAGRFVFFTVAAPPFFLVYTIPKFFVLKILPMMAEQLGKINLSLKQMFAHLNKMAASFLLNPLKTALSNIGWHLSKVEKQFNAMLNYMHSFMQSLSSTMKRSFSQMADPIKKMMRSLNEKLHELMKESSKVLAKATGSLQNAFQTMIQPLTNSLIPLFNNTGQVISKNLLQLKAKMSKKGKPFLKKCYNFASATASKGLQILPQIVQVAQPVINVFVPIIQLFKKHTEYGLKWMNKKPKEGFNKLLTKGKKVFAKVHPIIDNCYKAVISWLKDFVLAYILLFISFVTKIMKKGTSLLLSLHPSFQKGAHQAKNIGKFIQNKGMRIHSFILLKLSATYTFFKTQCEKFMAAPIDYTLGLIKTLFSCVVKVAKFSMLVVIAMVLVLKYWFVMLFELSEQLNTTFTKSK